MQVELSAKQLFIIKLALAQLEPVDVASINETRQVIDSSINQYPVKMREICWKCPYCQINELNRVYWWCTHEDAPLNNELHQIEFNVPEFCPINKQYSNG